MDIIDERIDSGKAFDWGRTSAEQLDFPKGTFDVITACQCFWYFDHEKIMPVLADLLKPGGEIAKWDKEHRALLDAIAPDSFEVLHYAAVTVLRKKD